MGTQPWCCVCGGHTWSPTCTFSTVTPVGFGRIFFWTSFAFTLSVRWGNVRSPKDLEEQ